MKTNKVSMLCVRSALLGGSVLGVIGAAASCSDVPIDCTVGRGAFGVKYIRAGNDPIGPCGLGNGDAIGAQAYNGRGAQYPGFPDAYDPDLKTASGALQAVALGTEHANRDGVVDMTGHPYAHGQFAGPRPDGNNFCTIPSAEAHLTAPWVPPTVDDPATPDDDESAPGVAPLDRQYVWKNVRFYVTPGIQGLQFDGDLSYTDSQYNAAADTGMGGTVCSDPGIKAVGLFYPGFANYTMPSSGAQSCVVEQYETRPDPADPTGMATIDYLVGVKVDHDACSDIKQSGVATDFPTECVPLTAPQYQASVFTCDATTCTDTTMTTSTYGLCMVVGAGTKPIPIVK